MKFAVIGGDTRCALLCATLCADGHRVCTYALEKAALPPEVYKAGCLQGCVYGADCVILPCPAETGGILNAPFAAENHAAEDICRALWPGQLLCGGRLSAASVSAAAEAGAEVEDIMQRPDFVVGNAVLTAEGAVGLLIAGSGGALWRGRALILGAGRIGTALAARLRALGAEVTVAARRAQVRAGARAFGVLAVDFAELEGRLGDFDYIINTVPARTISDAALCCVREDALLLELASAPGGFDRNLAENIGLQCVYAPGLPGKSSPAAAAELMRQAVYDILKEREERT